MMKITERVEGHYEVHETPFARTYEWHPAYTTLECACGEKLALSSNNPAPTTCRCGADHRSYVQEILIQDLQEREGHLRHKVTHPWRYDDQEQEDQHVEDEAAYSEDSPWRYNNS